jgi:hypothetical protein
MLKWQSKTRSRKLLRVLLGTFCVLLIAFSATVRVVHTHDLAGNSHPDCALCLVAHSGVTAFAYFVLPAPQQWITPVEMSPAENPRESCVLSFYCRPPPAEPASV